MKTLVKPRGHAFKVTPKGSAASEGGYERGIFAAATLLMVATFIGVTINTLPDWRLVAQGALIPMVAIWCTVNLIVLFLVSMLCLGRPVARAEERFELNEHVAIWMPGSNIISAMPGGNLSLSGIAVMGNVFALGDVVRVRLRGVGSIGGLVARTGLGITGIAFDTADCAARDRLIVKLFTSGRNTQHLHVPLWRATRSMISRIWSADMQGIPAANALTIKLPQAEARFGGHSYVMEPRERQLYT